MTSRLQRTVAFILLTTISTGGAQAELLGGVASGTFGETTTEEIQDFELFSFPALVEHPHEIVVHERRARAMIQCTLFDNAGNHGSSSHTFSRDREARLYFDDHVPDATARCQFVTVSRQVRPSTGGVVVNRLSAPPS